MALRQGRLEEADQLTSNALSSGKKDLPTFDFERLQLLSSEIQLARGRGREAFATLNQAPPNAPQLRVRWMEQRADALNRLERFDQSIALLDEIDTSLANMPAEQIDREARFTAVMVRFAVLSKMGRFPEAERMLAKGRKLAEEDDSSFERAAVLNNYAKGMINRGRFDEALLYSQPCLEEAERAGAGQLVALAHDNLGVSYRVLGDLDRAEEHQSKSIEQLRRMDDLGHLQTALGSLGNIDLERHRPERAIQNFREAFEMANKLGLKTDAASWAGQISAALIEQKNWTEADTWNQQANQLYSQTEIAGKVLTVKLNQASIASGLGNPEEAANLFKEILSQSSNDAYAAWSSHVRLARLFAQQKNVPEARKEYELALEVLDKRGDSFGLRDKRGISFGLTYRDRRNEFFKEYVEYLVFHDDPDRALQVVEFSRARTLAGKLGVKSQAIGSVDLNALQQYARQSGSVLLSYWLAPERSFVWIIKPDRIDMKQLPNSATIEPVVRAYRKMIEEDSRDPLEAPIPQAQSLSEMLLGPVIREIPAGKRVVVVPDGALHALNLETLQVPGADRYWIQDAEISVAPTLSMLPKSGIGRDRKNTLLLVGAPLAVDKAFPELPGAKSELEAIRTHFPEAGVSVRIGQDATPKNFFAAMPKDFKMIHFAAHAEANPQSPLESAVILSRDGDRFKLYAHEIADTPLSADLVTLSACHSAGARAYGGEGLVGFAWAFLQSGARSVIAGLWDVSDSSSSLLMDLLYQKLAAGTSPAAALREAKLEILKSRSYRKPFYWGPFQIFVR